MKMSFIRGHMHQFIALINPNIMNKYIALFFVFIVSGFILRTSGKEIQIPGQEDYENGCSIKATTSSTLSVSFDLGNFEQQIVETPKGEAWILRGENGVALLQKAAPDLPRFTSSLIIPKQSEIIVDIVGSKYIDYPDVDVAPSKGNLMRTQIPSDIPFEYGPVYSENAFFPGELLTTREPYTMRDVHAQSIVFYPFQYNPVTKVLRVYYEIDVDVRLKNDVSFESVLQQNKPNREFSEIYRNRFLNAPQMLGRYDALSEDGNMLIICFDDFVDEMQDFVDWKISTGMPTEIVPVSVAGDNRATIRDFITEYYQTNGLTYLLLVGDDEEVPAGYSNGPSDNYYSYLDGNDHYPEIFVGRFSAQTEEQVNVQVQKVLEYEKTPITDQTDWYKTVAGIASKQGPGDDNEYDYEHVRGMQQDLLNYTYTNNPEYFDGSQGGNDADGNPVAQMVENQVNDGNSLILYTGHGSTYAWSTSGFNSGGVNNLTNVGMLPFIWSVACVNGDFVNKTCFAESWLRATNMGEPTGAIATAMSSINQPWDPPMDGQDEMVDVLVESYTDNIKRTFGGLTIDGCMKMNDDYGWEGYRVTDTWVVFGDPSLMVRTDVPQTISASHPEQLFIGASQLTVICSNEQAKAALTANGEILATALVENSQAVLVFDELTELDTLHLVLTAYNHIPYIADIMVLPPDGPYVIYSEHSLTADPNQNTQLDYGESAALGISMKNVGIDAAANVQVNIEIDDEFISVTDATENYGDIQPNESITIGDAFGLSASVQVPDMHPFVVNITATDGQENWNSAFTMLAHAPIPDLADYAVVDEFGNQDGILDPGESGILKIAVKNTGSATANLVHATISTQDQGIVLSNPIQDYGNIPAGEENDASFEISAETTLPSGTIILFSLEIETTEGISKTATFTLNIGKVPVVVIDLDGNANSGPVIWETIAGLGVAADYATEIPEDMNVYSAAFVCLGMFNVNHVLSVEEGQKLADFLLAGNHLYMEGGDTWYYDQQNNPTAVHPLFRIESVEDGESDLSTIEGSPGLPTQGMSFDYIGDNLWVDRISPIGAAYQLFSNNNPYYGTCVGGTTSSYKTIGTSFEFGGLKDGDAPSTKVVLAAKLLEFFDLYNAQIIPDFKADRVSVLPGERVVFTDNSQGLINTYEWVFEGGSPQSSSDISPEVVYNQSGNYDVSLTISNGVLTHTLVRENFIDVRTPAATEETFVVGASSLTPNPAINSALLSLNEQYTGDVRIRIFNGTGMLIRETSIDAQKKSLVLDVQSLGTGVYYVHLISQAKAEILKLIVR